MPGASELLRQHFPAVELKDVTPAIDALRVIKSPREIEILTLNGRLSAEAIRKAIEITRPGRFEYQLEAEATYHLFKNGVQGNGYPAIVGTGPNVNVWHYQDNGRQMQAGDLVVMDYGGVAGLPGDRHHAHVAGLGPVRRAAAARVPVRARDAEGHHRGDASRRHARRDARDQQDASTRSGASPTSGPRRPGTSSA